MAGNKKSEERDTRSDEKNPASHVSRRTMLIGGGIAAAGLVAIGAVGGAGFESIRLAGSEADAAAPAPTPTPKTVRYVSTDLTIPLTTTWKRGTTAAGLLFVEPQVKGFNGLIVDQSGEPVWIEPTKANLTDLRVQTLNGKRVLTYWSGKSLGGHGEGSGTILDASYRKIGEVSAANGLTADLHEFNLTSSGTALLTSYSTVKHDLSSIGGPVDGYLYDCHVQEIDLATGAVLLDWDALDHVDIDETYLGLKQDKGHDGTSAGAAFDAFHLNAIDEDGDGLLVSLRHTHTVYSIDRKLGTVRWRLGGRHSDFALAKDAVFAWQHDVRRHPDGTISLFDNHLYSGTNGASRAMFFSLDESTMTATNTKTLAFQKHLGTAMGSVQLLGNGNVLVGWGTDPYVTEFTAEGEAVYQARLGGISYRASKSVWHATPSTVPDIAVVAMDATTSRVYASWNGATNVAKWRILAGESETSMQPAMTVPRSGFETLTTTSHAPKIAVQALDSDGAVLATSAIHSS
jgi:hypothetical protein